MNISPKEFRKKLLNKERLPSGLVVNGGLYLERCKSLTHLPSGLVVEGNLNLNGCTSLTHLPSGLVVNGDLWLRSCTSLPHLPTGLVVKNTIYCDNYLIDKIPEEDLPLYINFKFEEKIYEYFTRRIQKENIS